MIGFSKIISLNSSLLKGANVKLIRHKDSRVEYRDIVMSEDRDLLLEYQKEQSKNIFEKCDYICSFIGLDGTKSLFIGVFKVNGFKRKKDGKYLYDLVNVDEFDELKDRLIIDWGKSTLSWHQWMDDKKDKEVLEIIQKGTLARFPGLLNFTLSFNQLKKLIENSNANKEWYHQLSSVNGVYLILDRKTGRQYIGSAYGEEGIFQRWKEYVVTGGHGNNDCLKKLCSTNDNYQNNFIFTILQTLPSNIKDDEVIKYENLYKEKLGSRAFGLNKN